MSLNVSIFAKPVFFGDPELAHIEAASFSLVGLDDLVFNRPGITNPEFCHNDVLELLFKVTNAPEFALSDAEKAFIEANKEALKKLWCLSVGDVFRVIIDSEVAFKVCAPVGFVEISQESAKAFFEKKWEDRVFGRLLPAPKGFGSEPLGRKEFDVANDNQAELLLAVAEAEEA